MEIVVLFFVMLVIVGGQSLLFRKQTFAHFQYRCHFDAEEAFEGDTIEMVEEVSNGKWLPIPWLKAEITASKWLDFAGSQSSVTYNSRFVPSFFLVRSYQKITRRWKVACKKRGVFPIESVVLVATDLLGKDLLSQKAPVCSKVMVLPRPLEISQLRTNAQFLQGDHPVKSQLIPDPFYISGVREYLPGDPMKNIHWNATAKMGRIMVRNLEFTTRQNLTILLNIQTREYENEKTIDEENLEDCIRMAATLLDAALEENIPVQLAMNTNLTGERQATLETEQSFGREHTLYLLRLLAQIPYSSTQIFSTYLQKKGEELDSTDFLIITSYLNQPILEFCREQEQEGRRIRLFLMGEATEELHRTWEDLGLDVWYQVQSRREESQEVQNEAG